MARSDHTSSAIFSFFTPPREELSPELCEIETRLRGILTLHNQAEMVAVFQKIFDEGKFNYLVDLAHYYLSNYHLPVNRAFFGLICHSFLESFWKKQATTGLQHIARCVTPLGIPNYFEFKPAALAMPHDFKFNLAPTELGHALWPARSWFLLLAGLKTITRQDINQKLSSLVSEALERLKSGEHMAAKKILAESNRAILGSPTATFEKMCESNPLDNIRLLLLYALLQMKCGDFDEAIETIKRAHKINPSKLTHLGIEFIENPNPDICDSSSKLLQALLSYQDGNIDAAYKLSHKCVNKIKNKGTKLVIEKYRLLTRVFQLTQTDSKRTTRTEKNLTEAIACLLEYISKAPNDFSAKLLMSKLYREHAECCKLFHAYQLAFPDPDSSKQVLLLNYYQLKQIASDEASVKCLIEIDKSTMPPSELIELNELEKLSFSNLADVLRSRLASNPLKLFPKPETIISKSEWLAYYDDAYYFSKEGDFKTALNYLYRLIESMKATEENKELITLVQCTFYLIRLQMLESPEMMTRLNEKEIQNAKLAVTRNLEDLYPAGIPEWLIKEQKGSPSTAIKTATRLFGQFYAKYIEAELTPHFENLDKHLKEEAASELKAGADIFNDFPCLDMATNIDLEALKNKIMSSKDPFPEKMIRTLLQRALIASQTHGALGCLLAAEICFSITKCYEAFYPKARFHNPIHVLARKEHFASEIAEAKAVEDSYDPSVGKAMVIEEQYQSVKKQTLIYFAMATRLKEHYDELTEELRLLRSAGGEEATLDKASMLYLQNFENSLHNAFNGSFDSSELAAPLYRLPPFHCLRGLGLTTISQLDERYKASLIGLDRTVIENLIRQATDAAERYMGGHTTPRGSFPRSTY